MCKLFNDLLKIIATDSESNDCSDRLWKKWSCNVRMIHLWRIRWLFYVTCYWQDNILRTGIFNHLRERERDIISFFDSSKQNLKAAIIADVGYIFQSNVHYLYTRMNHQAKHCLGNQWKNISNYLPSVDYFLKLLHHQNSAGKSITK